MSGQGSAPAPGIGRISIQSGHAGYSGNPPVDIDKHIKNLTTKVMGYFITAVLFWFIGVAIGVFWEFNGTLHDLEARSVIAREVYDFKVSELTQKNQELERKVRFLECMGDKLVKDKAGCHQ